MLAHEYGHAVDQLAPRGDAVTSWDREIRADLFGATVVAQSSRQLDLVSPTIALQGAVVAMRAHDVLDAAHQIARHGQETGSKDSPTHPSWRRRLSVLEYFFLKAGGEEEQLPGLRVPAVTLGQLWDRVAPLLREQYRAGRRLHSIWRRR